jgi:hypothetical protein
MAELYVTVSMEELTLLLADSDQRQRCTINVSGAEGMEPVTMSLEFFERDFFRLSQYFVTVSPSQPEPINIQVTPEDENNPISILDVSVDVPFLSVETDGKTEIKIGFKEVEEIVSGYYFVTAEIENAKKRTSQAKITIHVPSGGE